MEYNYPKLEIIKDFLKEGFNHDLKDLSSVVILACQHILEPQKKLFQEAVSFGFKPENIFILGKIYSTSDEVFSELRQLGFSVIQPKFNPDKSFDQQHTENCLSLVNLARTSLEKAPHLIVLDDGGSLLSVVSKEDLNIKIVGVEQTSSGFRKLENLQINFPIYNVARSRIKLELETPFIVELGIRRIKEKIFQYIHAPKILVIGLGPIGIEMVQVLKREGFDVVGYDKIHGEQNLTSLIKENINVVIGTTGNQILSHDELLYLNSITNTQVLMVSMSSSDREFEIWKLRDIFNSNNPIHDDLIFENIIITNNGFPITFKGVRIEATPEQMDRTMSLLFLGILLGCLKEVSKNGFLDFPEEILKLLE